MPMLFFPPKPQKIPRGQNKDGGGGGGGAHGQGPRKRNRGNLSLITVDRPTRL